MVEIVQVCSRKEQKRFIDFPLKLYKGCPYFVPPLYGDEKKIFKKNYMYNEQATAVYYNAYRDGKMVGRISGIVQFAANTKWNQRRVRFTRFDSIDDQEVASALFKAVESWAKAQGMEEICGPLGFSDLEREGLLIEGFDQLSTFEEQYNYSYYQKLIEFCGYQKEVDWVERQLRFPGEIDPKMLKLTERILDKYELHIAKCKDISDFLDRYADQFFEILDETYDKLYGTVPFCEGAKQDLIKNFKMIIDLNHVAVIVDKNDKVVCFGLCFPSIAQAVRDTNGKLFPFGFIKLLKAIKHPNAIDLGLIGVVDEYKMKGVASVLIVEVMKILKQPGIEYAETNLNLEDNDSIQNQWKNFESVLHKRRRSFVKKI